MASVNTYFDFEEHCTLRTSQRKCQHTVTAAVSMTVLTDTEDTTHGKQLSCFAVTQA